MTERERIEKLLTKYHEEIGGYEYQKAYLERQIRICEKQLAALPPDKPDLSGWRKLLTKYHEEIGGYEYQKAYLERQIRICEKQLAALPPDKPDLSGWRPHGIEEYFFIRADGTVSSGPVEIERESSDCNYYETHAEAKRAAKRQRLHTRLWQCWERLYGVEGWQPVWGDNCFELLWKQGVGVVANVGQYSLQVFGVPVFRTQQDAQWAIEQLQSEGLL